MKRRHIISILTVLLYSLNSYWSAAQGLVPEDPKPEPRTPVVDIVKVYHATRPGFAPWAYIFLDTGGKNVESISLTVFDNLRTLNRIAVLTPELSDAGAKEQTVRVELPDNCTEDVVLQLTYKIEGQEEVKLPYWERGEYFDYLSDLPVRLTTGWGKATVNAPYGENQQLSIGNSNIVYRKGFGFHAAGSVESNLDLTPYYRFAADFGGHKITNTYRDRNIHFTLLNGATQRLDTVVSWESVLSSDFRINSAQSVKLSATMAQGGDNTNNVVAVGAPRLYYPPIVRQQQEIAWDDRETVRAYQAVTLPLKAFSGSGLTIDFRLVQGAEYAAIDAEGLKITSFPPEGGADIVVEAYQAGDGLWAPAPLFAKTYHLVTGMEVERDQRVKLKGSHTLDEIVVYADSESAGQIVVEDGLVSTRTLVVKYTFVPGEWNFITFPASVDIDRVSNLGELGYVFNNPVGPAYFIEAYDTKNRAEKPEGNPWILLDSPVVTGMKGYAMALDASLGTEPVEVTFRYTNANLDLTSLNRNFNISLDLTSLSPGTTKAVTVRPVNVDGNELNVNVNFRPSDSSKLPLDYGRALAEARYTFVGDKKAMRFTLPDQTPARVVFFDSEGRNVIKAVRYVSPMAIDITDLKPGTYNIVVGYGSAVRTFTLEL